MKERERERKENKSKGQKGRKNLQFDFKYYKILCILIIYAIELNKWINIQNVAKQLFIQIYKIYKFRFWMILTKFTFAR